MTCNSQFVTHILSNNYSDAVYSSKLFEFYFILLYWPLDQSWANGKGSASNNYFSMSSFSISVKKVGRKSVAYK